MLNYDILNDKALLQRMIADILDLFINKYPNDGLSFISSENAFIESLLNNKDTILIESVKSIAPLTKEENDLILLNQELQSIIDKTGFKGSSLKYNINETNIIINELSDFRDKNRKKLESSQLFKIKVKLKKLRKHLETIEKKTSN